MSIANPSKAFIVLCSLFALTFLMIHGAVPSDQGLPVLTAIVGYAIGNGIAAKTGQPVDPIIGQRKKP